MFCSIKGEGCIIRSPYWTSVPLTQGCTLESLAASQLSAHLRRIADPWHKAVGEDLPGDHLSTFCLSFFSQNRKERPLWISWDYSPRSRRGIVPWYWIALYLNPASPPLDKEWFHLLPKHRRVPFDLSAYFPVTLSIRLSERAVKRETEEKKW